MYEKNNSSKLYKLLKEKKLKIRSKEGITLIALVVTIVVLLILSGVTITAVAGEHGIIAKAREAKEKTEGAVGAEEEGMTDLLGKVEEILGGAQNTIPVTKITINEPSEPVKIGRETTLTVKVEPENATKKNVTWSSSNPEVATIDNGTVKGIKTGTTRAKSKYNRKCVWNI